MSTIERAIVIAAEVHAGQIDLAGEPYILHPLRVMLAMGSERGRIVGALHDVVEDSRGLWSIEALAQRGFDCEALNAIDKLTRPNGMPYADYIEALGRDGPPLAQAVKIADLRDNLAGERVGRLTLQQQRRIEVRYRPALQRLIQCANAWGF